MAGIMVYVKLNETNFTHEKEKYYDMRSLRERNLTKSFYILFEKKTNEQNLSFWKQQMHSLISDIFLKECTQIVFSVDK